MISRVSGKVADELLRVVARPRRVGGAALERRADRVQRRHEEAVLADLPRAVRSPMRVVMRKLQTTYGESVICTP
jgi:hypothetical protein